MIDHKHPDHPLNNPAHPRYQEHQDYLQRQAENAEMARVVREGNIRSDRLARQKSIDAMNVHRRKLGMEPLDHLPSELKQRLASHNANLRFHKQEPVTELPPEHMDKIRGTINP